MCFEPLVAISYVMGSVVRIKCVNFLTYSNAECYPGPNLNMVCLYCEINGGDSLTSLICHRSSVRSSLSVLDVYSLTSFKGPNGSGKSTVAAAIAIGLGYPPKVMGRSSALKNFVRENERDGHVEIELKGKPGRRNMVIKRYLNSSDNTSKFEINGKASSKDAVTEAVADLNVNVNNLW